MSHVRIRYRTAAAQAPEFCHEFLVECPRCGQGARLVPMSPTQAKAAEPKREREPASARRSARDQALSPRHLVCSGCGFDRTWMASERQVLHALIDGFKELALYLQVPCGAQVIWALNGDHLQYLGHQLRQVVDGELDGLGASEAPLYQWLETGDAEEISACVARLIEMAGAPAEKEDPH